jgi:secretion/DNA translocation related TadE-like protein
MRDGGNVSVLMVGGVALAAVLCLGVARVGGAVVLAARADTAADAAALAGADALALGRSPAAAVNAARAAAHDNGARLVSCTCRDGEAEVVIELGRAHGRARAVVDLSGEPAPGP